MDDKKNLLSAKLYPHYGILLSLFATAVLSLKIKPYVSIIPHASAVALGLQVLALFFALPSIRLRFKGVSLVVIILWLSLFFFSLVSVVWSGFPKLTLERSFLIYVPALIILTITYSDRKPVATFWAVAKGMAILGTSLAVIGLLIYVFGKVDLGSAIQTLKLGRLQISQVIEASKPLPRISSISSNPNALGAWLAVTVPMTLALYLARRLRLLLFAPLFSVQVIALLLSMSRAGIAAAVIAVALLFFTSARSAREQRIRGLLIAAVAIGAGVVLFFLYTKFHGSSTGRFSLGIEGRDLAWAASWKSFLKHPLSGVGFGVSQEAILNPIDWSASAHNCFLTVLTEIGVAGLLLFIAPWVIALVSSYKRTFLLKRQYAASDYIVLATSFAILLALVLHQFFETMVLRHDFQMLFLVYLTALSTHSFFLQEDNFTL